MTIARIAFLSLSLSLLIATGASAAVVTRVDAAIPQGDGQSIDGEVVMFTAAPGEANRVVMRAHGAAGGTIADTVTFHDAGAPLTAGAGCDADPDGGVTCALTENDQAVRVALGDGNDTFSIDPASSAVGDLDVRGEGGEDRLDASGNGTAGATLDGGAGGDALTGTPGRDDLTGGPGADVIVAGAGDDTIHAGATDPSTDGDTIEGGPGTDTADYSTRHVPVTVDLARPGRNAGARGERDRLTGVENVTGGHAADHLSGDAGPNRILAAGPTGFAHRSDQAGAPDVIRGGGGDDVLIGARGTAILDGGAGNDSLLTNGSGTRVLCGRGTDTVSYAAVPQAGGPRVEHDCETVGTGYSRLGPVDVVRGRTARVAVHGAACRGTVTLSAPGHPAERFGRATFASAIRATRTVALRLTARGRAAARHRAVVQVRVDQPAGCTSHAVAFRFQTKL